MMAGLVCPSACMHHHEQPKKRAGWQGQWRGAGQDDNMERWFALKSGDWPGGLAHGQRVWLAGWLVD